MMNREYYRQQGYHYIDERIEIDNRLRNAQTDEEKAMLLYELEILNQKEEDWQLREDKKIRRAEERRRVEELRRQAEERQQMEEEDPRRQAEEQRRRQERIAGQPIQRLHQDFQDVTGLSFGNLLTWDRYEAMIAYYGERDLTEQQLAMMPVAQRRRLINEYMNRGTARCVASGLMKGGVIPIRTDEQLESLQEQGQAQGARNFQEIEDYVIERAEIRENYRQFARLPVAKQIELIEEESISFDLLQEIYRVANKPIPFDLVLFYSRR